MQAGSPVNRIYRDPWYCMELLQGNGVCVVGSPRLVLLIVPDWGDTCSTEGHGGRRAQCGHSSSAFFLLSIKVLVSDCCSRGKVEWAKSTSQ